MRTNYDRVFEFTVGEEGGYSTDRADKGNYRPDGTFGGTKYGISSRSYPDLDIQNLTLAQAKAIYLRDFWTPLRCDDLPSGLDLVVFDAGVNSGPARSARWLQQACGSVRIDGLVGPDTLQAVNDNWAVNWEHLLEQTINNRWIFMQDAQTFPVHGKGWRARIMSIGKESRIWAREQVPAPVPPVVPDPGGMVPVPAPDDPSSRNLRELWSLLEQLVVEIRKLIVKEPA